MADDRDSEIGDATEEANDCDFTLKEITSSGGKQNDESLSQVFDNLNTEPVDHSVESEVFTTSEPEVGLERIKDGSSFMTDLIASGLSQLGRSADGNMHVFLKLCLSVSDTVFLSRII